MIHTALCPKAEDSGDRWQTCPSTQQGCGINSNTNNMKIPTFSFRKILGNDLFWNSCIRHINSTLLMLINPTQNYQEKCWIQTQTVCDRHRLCVTEIHYLWQKQTVCDRQRLSLTDRDCLWRTQIVCEGHKLSVTKTNFLWLTKTVCDGHRLSLTDTDYPDWHRLFMTDTDCLCQAQT